MLPSGEAAAKRRTGGYVDKLTDFIWRDRVRYWTLVLTPETFGAMVACWQELHGEQLRKWR